MDLIVIAFLSLIVNGLCAVILSRSKSESLNAKGAFLHVLADTLGSIGVISAGLIIFSLNGAKQTQ